MSTWKIGPDFGPLMKDVERIADALQRIAKVAEDMTADKRPGECNCSHSIRSTDSHKEYGCGRC